MKRAFFIFFVFFQCITYSQEVIVIKNDIIAASKILPLFEDSGIKFIYDVTAIEESYIQPTSEKITLADFLILLKNQASINSKIIDKSTYSLIKTDKIIDFCILIKDADFQNEIEGVRLLVNGKQIGISNSSGKIEQRLKTGSKLQLDIEGKIIKNILLTDSHKGCPVFLTENVISRLEEVVLNDYITKGIKQNRDGSIKLTPSKLGILPGIVEPDIFQSLQLIPGISSPNEDPALLHIRGGTPDQNLILWDGIKMYGNGHFFNQISAFNPYITKEIKIYRGGTSVQYGDRISGVIDIKSDDDLFQNKFGGGFNLTSLDFYLKTPIKDNIGILVSARRSINDFLDTFTFNSLSEKAFSNTITGSNTEDDSTFVENNFISTFSDFNIKAIWKIAPHQEFKISTIYIQDETFTEDIVTQPENQFNRNVDDAVFQSNFGASITYFDNRPKVNTKKIQAYMSTYVSEYDLQSLPLGNNPNEILFLERSDYIFDTGYDASIEIKLNDKKSLLFGQQTSYKEIFSEVNEGLTLLLDTSDFIDFSNIPSLLDIIGYGQYSYNSSKIKIQTGIRTGYYNNFETPFFEPRFFGSYKFSKAVRLTTSIEQKNQSISKFYAPQREPKLFAIIPLINQYWSEQRFDNKSLTTIRSNQATIGAIVNYDEWIFEIEGYYKDITGITPFNNDLLTQTLIVLEKEGAPEGTATRYGIDFLIKKKIGNYRAWLSYTFGKNSVSFKDLQESSFADPFDQRHRLNVSQTYRYKNIELGIGWTYGSGLPTTQILDGSASSIQNILNTNSLFNKRLPEYHRMDFSIFKSFKKIGKWKGKLGFAIRNIYARRTPIQSFYTFSQENNELVLNSNTSNTLGITADIVFRVTWD